jgi:hypothetical protein
LKLNLSPIKVLFTSHGNALLICDQFQNFNLKVQQPYPIFYFRATAQVKAYTNLPKPQKGYFEKFFMKLGFLF